MPFRTYKTQLAPVTGSNLAQRRAAANPLSLSSSNPSQRPSSSTTPPHVGAALPPLSLVPRDRFDPGEPAPLRRGRTLGRLSQPPAQELEDMAQCIAGGLQKVERLEKETPEERKRYKALRDALMDIEEARMGLFVFTLLDQTQSVSLLLRTIEAQEKVDKRFAEEQKKEMGTLERVWQSLAQHVRKQDGKQDFAVLRENHNLRASNLSLLYRQRLLINFSNLIARLIRKNQRKKPELLDVLDAEACRKLATKRKIPPPEVHEELVWSQFEHELYTNTKYWGQEKWDALRRADERQGHGIERLFNSSA